MFKINNKDTRAMSMTSDVVLMSLLLTLTYFLPFLVFLLLTLNMYLFAGAICVSIIFLNGKM